MKIALTPFEPSEWMGGWNYMLNLAETLATFGEEDVSTALFMSPEAAPEARARLAGIPRIDIIGDSRFAPVSRAGRLRQALLRGLDTAASDAFHAAAVTVALESAGFLGWRFPIPAFAWIPDFQHRHLPEMFTRGQRIRREIGFRAQIATGRSIMLSSRDAENDCHRFYPATRSRTRVASFAVQAPKVDDTAVVAVRARYGLPSRYAFIANQLWPHKNHAVAIDAAALLAQQESDLLIIASGETSSRAGTSIGPDLQARLEAKGAGPNFRFLGRIPFDDVMALSKGAAALLNPSRFEGWNTAVEEARSLGTPMILSDLPVHREQAGDIAQFFAADDAAGLARLLAALPERGLGGASEADSRSRRAAFAASVIALARDVEGRAS